MATPSSSATALSAPSSFQPGRRGFIQNLTTNPLYVKFGPLCSTSDYDFILNGAEVDAPVGTAGGDSTWNDYQGIVTIAGTSPTYVAWWMEINL